MKKAILLLALAPAFLAAQAQSTYYVDSLNKQLNHATAVPDKMLWLSQLASYYMGFDNNKSEEYVSQLMAMADSSRNREWMIKALLYIANNNYEFAYVQQSINKGLEYSQKAYDIAKTNHLDEYVCWAYIYMSRGYRSSGDADKALNCNNMALSIASSIPGNDSLKTYVYTSLARTYLAKNEKLLAFRNSLTALDIAENDGRYALLQQAYIQMADVYRSLSDIEKAKDWQFKRAALQREQHRQYDLLDTYQAIGDLYNQQNQFDLSLGYFQKAIALSDKLHLEIFKVIIYNSIINLYLHTGMYQQCVAYFNTHNEMKDFLNRAGMGYYVDYIYGILYVFSASLDSAHYYLKRAEPYILTRANKTNRHQFYAMLATYYRKLNNYDSAITYWSKARDIGQQVSDLNSLQYDATNLDTVYQLKGDYRNAYLYNTLYHTYTDSLSTLAKERDMMSLEIDNENRRKEREVRLEEDKLRRNHNLQYMAITVVIAGIFILLGAAGVFRVSKTFIEALGFFAFIFLFEFIILIADTKIHDITHGEPWKVLAIKIGLIAILLPLHHKIEEKVIHYLTTQELLRLKGKGLFGIWRKKKDADVPMGNL